ncbi:Acetolactate synthase large subunit [Seminavis robusta]|uniref:Acetolactate synthase large subunit n=1 Tax=Seminavis robusta TaxID=568900 RepID=A0A9N8HS70_9STRA|nr:Acetolactate synthase large subunit [Seminavis robusta]|eukprot:Sro1405_g269790.1 Acetolactate synthase large subunit (572) ;mRNA; r:7119-9006
MTTIKTSDLFVDILISEGVKFVFGIPGEENLDFTESMRHRADQIKLILVRHEQAAGFMAATVGRLTGQPGVALSTLGPGATNFTTSAAFAFLGGFPCLFITGQKPIKNSKQADFQIINVVEMMRPITKYTKSIPSGNMLAASVRRALSQSVAEKPGPVHIELAEDVAAEETASRIFETLDFRRPIAEPKAIDRATEILLSAKNPVVIIGAAANRQRAIRALRAFVEEMGIFWCSTQMGKGVLDERSPLCLGVTALSNKDYCHYGIDFADVLLICGHDESEKPPIIMTPEGTRKVIHVGFSQANVDNVYSPSAQVVGDVANAVWQIHEKLRASGKKWDQPILKRYKELSDPLLRTGMDDSAFPMNVTRVVADIRKVLPEDGILSLDNGLYKVVFARLFQAFQPNTILLDNALATMGAGIPNAIACKLLFPDRKVVSISGDGGAQMNLPELATCIQYKISSVHIILNDNAFGMIKWKQGLAGFENWGLDLQNPDFVEIAKAYGAQGYRVAKAEEFAAILETAMNSEGVHLIEVPFSYESMAADLIQVPKKAEAVVEQIKQEFGTCVVENCLEE